jgi:hypothetical protein
MSDRNRKGREYFNDIASRWSSIRREMLAGLDLNSEILGVMKKASVTADLGCGIWRTGGTTAAEEQQGDWSGQVHRDD